jgi:tyrosyl-tRNA synthetase
LQVRNVLKWFQDKGFEEGTIVTGATSKIGVALYDLSESGFKQRIAVGEMVSKSRKQVIGLPFGLFAP